MNYLIVFLQPDSKDQKVVTALIPRYMLEKYHLDQINGIILDVNCDQLEDDTLDLEIVELFRRVGLDNGENVIADLEKYRKYDQPALVDKTYIIGWGQ